jgi:hypothetical protein
VQGLGTNRGKAFMGMEKGFGSDGLGRGLQDTFLDSIKNEMEPMENKVRLKRRYTPCAGIDEEIEA